MKGLKIDRLHVHVCSSWGQSTKKSTLALLNKSQNPSTKKSPLALLNKSQNPSTKKSTLGFAQQVSKPFNQEITICFAQQVSRPFNQEINPWLCSTSLKTLQPRNRHWLRSTSLKTLQPKNHHWLCSTSLKTLQPRNQPLALLNKSQNPCVHVLIFWHSEIKVLISPQLMYILAPTNRLRFLLHETCYIKRFWKLLGFFTTRLLQKYLETKKINKYF